MDDTASTDSVALGSADDAAESDSLTDISAGVRESYEKVPFIGTRWRWYDVPYRGIETCFTKRKYWGKLPRSVRSLVNRAMNELMAFNHLERARISHLDKPIWNLQMPAGEAVTLPYFWMVEYYSPSHATELTRRLSRRKWRLGDFTRPESPGRTIKHGRERQDPLGWHSVATIIPSDVERWMPGAIRARIPEQFNSIAISMLPLGSALTAVVARFEVTESAALSMDAAGRAKHQPELYRLKGRLQVRERFAVGVRTVRQSRENLHGAARAWFGRELPGLFAVEAGAKHPALDLLITNKYDPFEAPHDLEGSNFRRAVGLDTTPYRLTYISEWKNIRLQDYLSDAWDGGTQDPGSALVCRMDKAFGKKALHGERNPHTFANELEDGISGLVTRVGLFELLRVKHEQASRARDQASNLHARRPVASARRLRKSVLESSLDMATVADDIEKLTGDPYRYEWNVPTVIEKHRNADTWSKPDSTVLRFWAKRQGKSAKRLSKLDESLLSILGLASNLNSSIEGIRSQRWSLVVAFLSLASSGIAIWLAYLALASPTPPTP